MTITHKPDCYGKGQCDCEPEEWAIVDLAVNSCNRWFIGYSGRPRLPQWGDIALRYDDQRDAATTLLSLGLPTLRIVPAPPKPACEMTDAGCWEWLHSHPRIVLRAWRGGPGPTDFNPGPNIWCVVGEDDSHPRAGGATPCDAIRAARRALEAKQ